MKNRTRRKLLRDLAGMHGRLITWGLSGAIAAGLTGAGSITGTSFSRAREVPSIGNGGHIRLTPPRHSVKRRG